MILGLPISPPPQNIEPLNPDTRGATAVREQLALHSQEGSCASCHKKFDPYGFALESFDVMGNHRQHYRVLNTKGPQGGRHWQDVPPVDPHGVTPQGEEFGDINSLRQLIAKHPERLAWGVTWHLMTFASGTPTGHLDREAISRTVDGAASEGYGLRSLIHGILQSETFRQKYPNSASAGAGRGIDMGFFTGQNGVHAACDALGSRQSGCGGPARRVRVGRIATWFAMVKESRIPPARN